MLKQITYGTPADWWFKPELRRLAWGTSRSVWREPAWIVYLVQILVVVAIRVHEIGTRLKRSRFPCEQHLDMGKSVLTPEENLLGKACEAVILVVQFLHAMGERVFGQHSETRKRGTEASKQMTTVVQG